jgi:hypothetical protein
MQIGEANPSFHRKPVRIITAIAIIPKTEIEPQIAQMMKRM